MNPPASLISPVGVLGYGVEGQSTCRFLLRHGITDIVVFDRMPPSSLAAPLIYGGPEAALSRHSHLATLFRSAGIRPDHPELEAFRRRGGHVTSQIETFFEMVDRRRIIGVTGTLGKGTCCSLLQAMLEKAGIGARAGGNIGVAALDLVDGLEKDDMTVLELSSFQLSTLRKSPAIAVVLKTTSEHLDWHISQEEYWDAKANLVRSQEPCDMLIYCADAAGSAWVADQSRARKIPFGMHGEIRIQPDGLEWPERAVSLRLDSLQIQGAFNLENMAGALGAALSAGAAPGPILAAAQKFSGLEHRLEKVRDLDGVSFFNDSYATRPDATLGAIAAFGSEPLGLILGGSEKHADFTELSQALSASRHIRAIALIGATAERLYDSMLAHIGEPPPEALPKMLRCASLQAALDFLRAEISRGVILFSPACASFGMFADYRERGRIFKEMVHNL